MEKRIDKLIIASNNQGKIREIKSILAPHFKEIISLREAGVEADPVENGQTFFDNALIKAREINAITKCAVISDDSGLIVDALDGQPGVFSARFAGVNATDADNNRKLLSELEGKTPRTARFFCCAVLLFDHDDYIFGEGAVEGEILHEVTGEGGFGYDPIFYCYELQQSFGQASAQQKNTVSHRFRAICQLRNKLKE